MIDQILVLFGLGCVVAVLWYLAARMVRRPSARQDVVGVGEQAAHPLPSVEPERPLNFVEWWQNQ